MNKEEFKTEQPVVYQTLSNALKGNHLAHAYLFTGSKGSPKSQVALLFAQSLVCEHPDEDGFACQECPSCKRMEKKESLDYFRVEKVGTKIEKVDPFNPKNKKTEIQKRIRKQDIVDLQNFFENTSIEVAGNRVYILEDYDQATPDASNSLLKFLEEPQPGIYGILIAEEKSAVLPTIQSRCQWIQFRPAHRTTLIRRLEEITDPQTADMLVKSGYTYDEACEVLGQEEFEDIHQAAKSFMESNADMQAIYTMQTEVFVPKSALMQKQYVTWWLQWVLYIVKESETIELENKAKLLNILVESLDLLRRPIDLALFLDKIYNQIRREVKE